MFFVKSRSVKNDSVASVSSCDNLAFIEQNFLFVGFGGRFFFIILFTYFIRPTNTT